MGDRTLESVTFYESDGSGGLAPQGRVEYDYDHAGEKIARRVYDADGALLSHRKYLVDHQNPTGYSQTLAELEIVDPDTGRPSEADDATARVARLNTFDPLGPVAQTDFEQTDTGLSKTYRHLFADPLGSIRTLTSQTDSGTIESVAEDYTAFGTPINGSLTSGEPPAATPQYAFTAQTRDPYSGLQYHRARWLNTGIGQWTSSDPVFDFPRNWGSDTGYAGMNGILNVDISGQSTLVNIVVTVALVGMLSSAVFGLVGGLVGGLAYQNSSGGFFLGASIGAAIGVILSTVLIITAGAITFSATAVLIAAALIATIVTLWVIFVKAGARLFKREATPSELEKLRKALRDEVSDTEVLNAMLTFLDKRVNTVYYTADPAAPFWMSASTGDLIITKAALNQLPSHKIASALMHEFTHLSGSGPNATTNQVNILGGGQLVAEMEQDAFTMQLYFEEKYLGAGKGFGRDAVQKGLLAVPFASYPDPAVIFDALDNKQPLVQNRFAEVLSLYDK